MAVGAVIGKHNMAKHFAIEIADTTFAFARKTAAIAAEAALDGLYAVPARHGPRRQRHGQELQVPRPGRAREAMMQAIIERCCGLDVHQETVVACLLVGAPGAQPNKEVRTFGAVTRDLEALRDWLCEAGVTRSISS